MLYAVGIILLTLALLFWNYGGFATTVVRWCKPLDIKKGKPIKRPPITSSEALKCYVPFLQVMETYKALHGTYGWTMPVGIISSSFIVLRLLNAFLLPISDVILFVTMIMMWIGLLLYVLLYGIVTFQTARMYEFSTGYALLVFVLPHIFCGKMSTGIAHRMRAMQKEEVFDEHHGDTVIKSRHS